MQLLLLSCHGHVISQDDVNTEFEKQQRSQQESNKRYNKLVASYRNSSKRGGDEEAEEAGDEGR
jgi:hypothetical protein